MPDVPPQQQYTRLSSASQVTLVDGRPLLAVVLAEVVGPEGGGWLNVQWFGPSNTQVASDSVWVSGEDVGRTFEFALPDDVETTSGEWRVVVSHGGYLLRQFRVEVP